MANFDLFFPRLMQEEGGAKITNAAGDNGGATKWGITLKSWLENGHDENGDGKVDAEDLKLSTENDAKAIAKKKYWDPICGDQISSQSVAEFLFDWAYNSGPANAAKHLQKILSVVPDGCIGQKTLARVALCDAQTLFNQLKTARLQFISDIVATNPSQKKWLNGWNNRVHAFQFKY